MLFARSCVLLVLASTVALPVFAQSGVTTSQDAPIAASTNYASLRDNLADQTETLTSDVSKQRAILRKNLELLKEAQRLDAANKKMLAEKQRMLQQNAQMEKQRAALSQTTAVIQSQSQSQSQPASSDVTMAKASAAEIK